MAEPIRFGVLGCANIARKVIRAMTLAEGVEACAVGSRSLDKAKQFAAELKEKTVRFHASWSRSSSHAGIAIREP